MFRLPAAVLFTVLGTQLSALSCVFPEISETYVYYDESPSTYVVLLGQIKYDVPVLPSEPTDLTITLQGQFEGFQIGRGKDLSQLSAPITVQVGCDSTWGCGFVSDAPDTISFVQLTDDGYFIQGSLCPGDQYSNADPANMNALQRCMRGGC